MAATPEPQPLPVLGLGDPDDPAVAARRRTADSARALFAALVSSGASPEVLDGVARRLDGLAVELEPDGRTTRYHGTEGVRFDGDNGVVFETHPIVGPGNPMAPPLAVEHADDGVVATATYDQRFEGIPGCVHGGLLAAAFDVVLGGSAARAGHPIVTGTLTIRYRRPTPLHTELRFEGRLDRVEGRQVFSSAHVRAGDEVTAEAEAVFVTVDRERFPRHLMTGPLTGLRVVEMVGLGPGPFCGMLLADMGAEVLRVDRVAAAQAIDRSRPATSAMDRGKQAVAIDLKHPDGVDALMRLIEQADVFFEVFRPGVAERLGVGPDPCLARNPRLVYGRLTGWGQDGPLAHAAGHDIDYIALSGALEPLGRAGEKPTPPINVLGDFAGGGMLLAFGIACAAFETARSGEGQVVDAAMVDGAALMLTPFFAARASGFWGERGTNHLDTGAHFYEVYETADAKFVAVGSVEPHFYAELVKRLGVDLDLAAQYDKATWPEQKEQLAAVFRTKSRDEWCELLEGTDACFAPVLTPLEAPDHPHNRARRTFLELAGAPQPAPAPRFSRTPADTPQPAMHPGAATDEVLAQWGFEADEVARLRDSSAVL